MLYVSGAWFCRVVLVQIARGAEFCRVVQSCGSLLLPPVQSRCTSGLTFACFWCTTPHHHTTTPNQTTPHHTTTPMHHSRDLKQMFILITRGLQHVSIAKQPTCLYDWDKDLPPEQVPFLGFQIIQGSMCRGVQRETEDVVSDSVHKAGPLC